MKKSQIFATRRTISSLPRHTPQINLLTNTSVAIAISYLTFNQHTYTLPNKEEHVINIPIVGNSSDTAIKYQYPVLYLDTDDHTMEIHQARNHQSELTTSNIPHYFDNSNAERIQYTAAYGFSPPTRNHVSANDTCTNNPTYKGFPRVNFAYAIPTNNAVLNLDTCAMDDAPITYNGSNGRNIFRSTHVSPPTQLIIQTANCVELENENLMGDSNTNIVLSLSHRHTSNYLEDLRIKR